MSGKTLSRSILKRTNLNALSLVKQYCDLVFVEEGLTRLNDVFVAGKHLIGHGF